MYNELIKLILIKMFNRIKISEETVFFQPSLGPRRAKRCGHSTSHKDELENFVRRSNLPGVLKDCRICSLIYSQSHAAFTFKCTLGADQFNLDLKVH